MKTKTLVIALIGMNLALKAQSIPVTGDGYHYYGPNSTWNEYLKVGGHERGTDRASIVATNGNLHVDSKNGFGLYLNHYSQGKTLINPQGGNVGIGTTIPSNPLHILSSSEHHQLRLEGANGKHTWIEYYPSGTGVVNWQNGVNTNGFNIYDKTNAAYRLTISNSGNVGIGTIAPNERLDINGNILVDRMIKIDGHGSVASLQIMDNSDTGTPDIVLRGDDGDSYLKAGSLGIGTTDTGTYKLAVNGNVRAKEIKVETGWSDFVFEKGYDLPTLEEVEAHINAKGHLKDIPSAAEVAENGILLGEMDSKLLQKIEELTLYIIDINERTERLERENAELKKELTELK